MKNRFLVTGGAGFIGSALVRTLVSHAQASVLVVDNLTYAGVPESLAGVGLEPSTLSSQNPNLSFLRASICDRAALDEAFRTFQPQAVFHLAAESHVDRSIDGPEAFIQTNIVGTETLLQASLAYWKTLPLTGENAQADFRFQHISTDEVYGALGSTGFFTEQTPYQPHSPYSASKASSDHLVRAWHDTYRLPTLITNCSNNYGPYQFPEKLIPLVILNALDGKPLPVYGTGANVRDWLFVEDHVSALLAVNAQGRVGETYLIGGHHERTNLEVVRAICSLLDELKPRADGISYHKQITFVTDRPGHDLRYAIDPTKIQRELKWTSSRSFEMGLRETVSWYLENAWWWQPLRTMRYTGERLGHK